MSNIIDSIQLSGVTYTIQGSGGGKAIEAGRGISITTGETADTVSFNLPISAGTRTNSVIEGSTSNFAIGNYAHAEGDGTTAATESSHAEGRYTITKNNAEHASGQFNNSVTASTTFGDSGNTLFSVGNGTSNSARHNAFEIRQNGDIYLSSGGTDIKLQDHLGGGGGNTTVELTQAEYDALVTAGTVSPTTYYIITDAQAGDLSQYWTSAQTNSAITQATSGKVDTSTYSTYTAATDTALDGKQATLVSGTNIKTINNESILGSGNIDIQGGGSSYSAGTGIDITNDVISCTVTGGGASYSASSGINIANNEISTKIGGGLRYAQDGTLEVNSTNVIATGNTQVPLSYVVYNYVNNNCMMKNKIWCGTITEYNSITNKDSGTLYLIHE